MPSINEDIKWTIYKKFLLAVFILMLRNEEIGITCSTAFHVFHSPSRGIHPPVKPTVTMYANGKNESTLPVCEANTVCSKIDVYDKPWIEKQCRCKNNPCSTSVTNKDGFTISDKTRYYKLCEPVSQLPKCRFFRDITWTIITKGTNATQQMVHCICPKDSVAYMIKRQMYSKGTKAHGYKYSFACSPRSRILCQRKDPCRLFTVKKRSNVTEVNMSTLCYCPRGYMCPRRHYDEGAVPGKVYPENRLSTYSGYCIK